MRPALFALIAAFIMFGTEIGRAQDHGAPTANAERKAELKEWGAAVLAKLQEAKVYPNSGDGPRLQGRVVVQITVARSGRLLNAYVAQTSKSGALDAAALVTMYRAAPFPPLPQSYAGEAVNLRIPLTYSVRKRFSPSPAAVSGSI